MGDIVGTTSPPTLPGFGVQPHVGLAGANAFGGSGGGFSSMPTAIDTGFGGLGDVFSGITTQGSGYVAEKKVCCF